MKKVFIISFALICIIGKSQSNYFPLPDSNAIWAHMAWSNQIYTVKGDSVIGSLTYKKYYSVTSMMLSQSSFSLVGLVRQDIAAKKVFAIKPGTNFEKLLYNFNLNINDTIRVRPLEFGYYNNFNAITTGYLLKVLQKDSILIKGSYRKRLTLGCRNINGTIVIPSTQEYWIEGVGSSSGILNAGGGSCNLIIDGCNPLLICLKQNDTLVYQTSTNINCGPYSCQLNVLENGNLSHLKIYPNPTSNKFQINLPDNGERILTVTNIFGEIIITKLIKEPTCEIELSNYQKGIYFVNLSVTNKGKISAKLIKE